ncbi:polynucleotide kinase [Mycobacterium phage Omega]|uniref:Polynucleotide kinase n=1 Tax=Mycobacterium phage Omega TaxID=2907835 RepID=Q854D1_BPMOM|nr:polynucleotide kinase [Mycobacterium phage Omega]AAN12777.1 polynucleotide kinase [Mycobacterium phage Omega]
MATKLWAMRGFSGSGKSRRAREIADQNDAVVVNRDMLRMQLLGEWWTGDKEDEDRVTIAEEAQVVAFLKSETSVVIDNTHINPAYLRKWARLATRLGVEFEVVDVHADVDECKRRVYQRWENEMGTPLARYLDPKVIEQQAKRFPVEKWPVVTAEPFIPEPAEYDGTLFKAILVDIDGTVSRNVSRSHYDYTKVLEDEVHEEIAWLVRVLFQLRYFTHGQEEPEIIFMSGRDHTCYDDTVAWLNQHDIPFDRLIMRPADAKDECGNKLPDYLVKYRLFNEHIRDKFDVLFVLDDRQQVVDMWRKLGLKCLQVAPGDF